MRANDNHQSGGGRVGAFRVSIAGIMLIIALLAVDYVVVAALKDVPNLDLQIVFIGALPMANLAAACLAFAGSRLARRGEVGLPLVTFALVGGVGILILLAIANLAPQLLYEYLDIAVGLFRGPRQALVELHRFGRVWTGNLAILLVYGAMTPPVLVPALLGGWMTRGYRLRLVKGSAGDPTRKDDRPTRP